MNVDGADLNQLKDFLAIHAEGSVSRAAEADVAGAVAVRVAAIAAGVAVAVTIVGVVAAMTMKAMA